MVCNPGSRLRTRGRIRIVGWRQRPAWVRLVLRRRRRDQFVRDDRRGPGAAGARRRPAASSRSTSAQTGRSPTRSPRARVTSTGSVYPYRVLPRRYDALLDPRRRASTGGRLRTPTLIRALWPNLEARIRLVARDRPQRRWADGEPVGRRRCARSGRPADRDPLRRLSERRVGLRRSIASRAMARAMGEPALTRQRAGHSRDAR